MTFQPGQSGNPAGRPKGSVNRQLAMLREAVEQVLPLVLQRALDGDTEAQKLILERGLPRFKQVEFRLTERQESSTEKPVSVSNAYLYNVLSQIP